MYSTVQQADPPGPGQRSRGQLVANRVAATRSARAPLTHHRRPALPRVDEPFISSAGDWLCARWCVTTARCDWPASVVRSSREFEPKRFNQTQSYSQAAEPVTSPRQRQRSLLSFSSLAPRPPVQTPDFHSNTSTNVHRLLLPGLHLRGGRVPELRVRERRRAGAGAALGPERALAVRRRRQRRGRGRGHARVALAAARQHHAGLGRGRRDGVPGHQSRRALRPRAAGAEQRRAVRPALRHVRLHRERRVRARGGGRCGPRRRHDAGQGLLRHEGQRGGGCAHGVSPGREPESASVLMSCESHRMIV